MEENKEWDAYEADLKRNLILENTHIREIKDYLGNLLAKFEVFKVEDNNDQLKAIQAKADLCKKLKMIICDDVLPRKNDSFVCECGCTFSKKSDIVRHKKTNKHKVLMENKN